MDPKNNVMAVGVEKLREYELIIQVVFIYFSCEA